jgi:hypothetical protein
MQDITFPGKETSFDFNFGTVPFPLRELTTESNQIRHSIQTHEVEIKALESRIPQEESKLNSICPELGKSKEVCKDHRDAFAQQEFHIDDLKKQLAALKVQLEKQRSKEHIILKWIKYAKESGFTFAYPVCRPGVAPFTVTLRKGVDEKMLTDLVKFYSALGIYRAEFVNIEPFYKDDVLTKLEGPIEKPTAAESAILYLQSLRSFKSKKHVIKNIPMSLVPDITFSKSQIEELGKYCYECDDWVSSTNCSHIDVTDISVISKPKKEEHKMSLTIPPSKKPEVPVAPPKKNLEKKRSQELITVSKPIEKEVIAESLPKPPKGSYVFWDGEERFSCDFPTVFQKSFEGYTVACKHLTFNNCFYAFANHIMTYHSNEKIPVLEDPTLKSMISSLSPCKVCKAKRTFYDHFCPEHTFFGEKGSYLTEQSALLSSEFNIYTDHSYYYNINDKWICTDVNSDFVNLDILEKLPIKPKAFQNVPQQDSVKDKKKPTSLKEAFDTHDWDTFEKFLNEFIDSKLKQKGNQKPKVAKQEKAAPPPPKEVKKTELTTVEQRLKEIWPPGVPGSRRWLRQALTVDLELATKDYKSKVLTKESFDSWLTKNRPLPQIHDKKLLISEINKTWFDYKQKNPDVKVYQNPKTEKEREALNLRKELWKKATPLSEEEKKKLSIPKVRVQPKKKQDVKPKKGKTNSSPKGSDLLGGFAPLFALLKELKTVLT